MGSLANGEQRTTGYAILAISSLTSRFWTVVAPEPPFQPFSSTFALFRAAETT